MGRISASLLVLKAYGIREQGKRMTLTNLALATGYSEEEIRDTLTDMPTVAHDLGIEVSAQRSAPKPTAPPSALEWLKGRIAVRQAATKKGAK